MPVAHARQDILFTVWTNCGAESSQTLSTSSHTQIPVPKVQVGES